MEKTRFDFTTMIDRRGRDSIAVDLQENDFWKLPQGKTKPGFDKIPMWIADMNFPTAPSVTEEILKRASHPIYGYFVPSEEYYASIIRWHDESFGVKDLRRENIGYENGVLGGITSALHVLATPGEPILVHSPTYTGFTTQLERNGYPAVLSPLKADLDGVLRMDFEDMEQKIRNHKIHTALFCSPHNPSGRVWERRELEQAIELFKKYDVYVISDEIWADLTLFGHRHIPTQSVSEDARMRTVAFYSPSKTFNLAGLVGSYHIVYNKKLSDQLKHYEALGHYNDMNVFSMHALIGAYRPEGREWMDELKKVLEANIQAAYGFFNGIDGINLSKPQGTYVIVPDFHEWCSCRNRSLDELLSAGVEVGVLWRDGRQFHIPYGIRMTLGLPTEKLNEVLERLQRHVL